MRGQAHGAALALGLSVIIGCTDQGARTTTSPSKPQAERGTPSDHTHERGKMLIADAGKHHGLLTAHLSKDGHELDIFFETTDPKNPQPVAVPSESFMVQVRTGDGELHEVAFACAPESERPKGEKPGTCSHFVGKVPWLKPDDTLQVVARVKMADGEYRVNWENFVPKKYAHHED